MSPRLNRFRYALMWLAFIFTLAIAGSIMATVIIAFVPLPD